MDAAYDRDGFLVLERVFELAELEEARARLEEIQAGVAVLPQELARHLVMERDLPAAKREGTPAEATGDAIFIVGALPLFGSVFLRLLADRRVLEPLRALVGGDLRYHFSNATIKYPRFGSGINWHRDFPNRYICPERPSFLRVMLCLDDTDEDNGATRFRCGSHRGAEEGGIRSAVCPAGSLVFIHPQVLHGGPVNRSARIRRNLIAQWGRADDPPRGDREVLTGASPEEVEAWQKKRWR